MESIVYRNCMRTVFTGSPKFEMPPSSLALSEMCRKFLVVDTSPDNQEFEIPVIARAPVLRVLGREFRNRTGINRTVIPLYSTVTVRKRSADSIFQYIVRMATFNKRLITIITSKGQTYYGGYGILLDADWNPLMLATLLADKEPVSGSTSPVLYYYKAVLHISPKVFLNQTDLLEKSIIKKVIPFYLTNPIGRVSSFRGTESDSLGTVQIEVDDMSRFFHTPVIPKPDTYSDEEMNRILAEHAKEISWE